MLMPMPNEPLDLDALPQTELFRVIELLREDLHRQAETIRAQRAIIDAWEERVHPYNPGDERHWKYTQTSVMYRPLWPCGDGKFSFGGLFPDIGKWDEATKGLQQPKLQRLTTIIETEFTPE